MRLTSLAVTSAVFLAAFGAALFAATTAVDVIEDRSQVAVQTRLNLAGHDWVDVSVDGLQLHLAGTAPDEATRFAAIRTAGAVVDAARIRDQMQVAAAEVIEPPRFSVEILRGDHGVSVIGLFPDTADRDRLLGKMRDIVGDEAVTDLMETSTFPAPDGWTEALEFGLLALTELAQSKISIAADRVTVTAIAPSERDRDRVEAKLRSLAPEGMELSMDISAPRAVITPFTLRLVMDEAGARFDACTAQTEAGLAKITAAAEALGVTADCRVGLGSPTPDWADAVTSGIAAVGALGGGTLTFSDTDVSLVAPLGTAQADFDEQVGTLQAALPQGFSLTAVLPDPPEAAATEAGPPAFQATRNAEGRVQLRGSVLDERAKSALASFAQARFGLDSVSDGTRVTADLPVGWSPRVLAALDALTLVETGSVSVAPDKLTVQGVSGLPEARAEIARRLSARLTEGVAFDIAVTYDRRFDPTLNLPTPETCAERVNLALGAEKITFEPGSDAIDATAATTLDKVAEILWDCRDVEMHMEIGGYTDSQGRESMNLELSQARAEAVLIALRERRVPTSNLTARGYGEEMPVADNETEEGREANRRIEVKLLVPVGPELPDAAEGADAAPDAATDAEASEAEADPAEALPPDEVLMGEGGDGDAVAEDEGSGDE